MSQSTRIYLRLALLLGAVAFMTGATCAPVLLVGAPVNGIFVNGNSVTVTGNMLAPAGTFGDLTVNGVSVPTVGPLGAFSVNVPLSQSAVVNPIVVDFAHANGTDHIRVHRTVIATNGISSIPHPAGQLIEDSLLVRLNDSGIDELEEALVGLVPLDIAGLIPAGLVVFDDCWLDIFGCSAGAKVTIGSNPPPGISDFGININSQTDEVQGIVTATGIVASIDIDGKGLVPNCDATITANTAILSGHFALSGNGTGQIEVDQNGTNQVQLGGFEFNFTGGICDSFIGDIILAVAPDLHALFKNTLSDLINEVDGNGETLITAALEEVLGGLDLSGPLGEIGTGFGTDLELVTSDVLEDIWGMTVLSDVGFSANAACDPPAETPTFPYSYRLLTSPPTLGAGSIFGPYEIGFSVSASAFNQLLASVVECGLLSLSLTELDPIGVFTGNVLSLFFPELAQFPLSTQYEFRVRPLVAPVLTGTGGPGGSLLELRLAGLELQLRDTQDQYGKLLDIVLDASAGLDVDVANGELALSIVPPTANDIAVTVTRNEIGTNEQTIQDIFELIVQFALPDLVGAIASFPLPDLEGLQLEAVGVLRQSKYVSMYLNLSQP